MKITISVDEDGSEEVKLHSEMDVNSSINSVLVTLDKFTDRLADKLSKAAIDKGATVDNHKEIVLQIKFSDIDSL